MGRGLCALSNNLSDTLFMYSEALEYVGAEQENFFCFIFIGMSEAQSVITSAATALGRTAIAATRVLNMLVGCDFLLDLHKRQIWLSSVKF